MVHPGFDLIWICCLLTGLAYVLLVLNVGRTWNKIPEFVPQPGISQTTISIVIPARDEEQKIVDCLNHVSRQNYPRHLFELIVVDDGSTDRTASLVNKFIQEHTSLAVKHIDLTAQQGFQGKKAALKAAIALSSATLIVTLDADCTMGPEWLATLAAFYEQHQPAFIIGPVVLEGDDSGIQLLQVQEMMCLSAFTFAYCQAGQPIMCNGANLAYQREAFIKAEGFTGIDQLASGDDVLLMNKIHRLYPSGVRFLKSREAIVSTRAIVHFPDFVQQRIRWLTKSNVNPSRTSMVTGLLVGSLNLLILGSLLFSFFYGKFAGIFLVLSGIKFLADLNLLRVTSVFFRKKVKGSRVFATALLYPFYVVLIVLLSIRTRYEWKGRKVR
jgi:cellulose synthase/poly-beta-1,6-N-acetylglucosamine synthase-like glycosyltransferase